MDINHIPQTYWNERWLTQQTGWDTGYASPAITTFMSQYENKKAEILIAGCGNAYEAEFLVENGFENITLVDIAPAAVARLQRKFADRPQIKVICQDYFEHQGQYDLMIEQTFFCAIHPDQRAEYVHRAASLLKVGGKLIGLLFSIEIEKEGPPFGGSKAEYERLFSPYFTTKVMAPCYNSIPPRSGNELFIHFVKK